MTPLRQRMTEDMRTAGLASGTQALYLDAVRNLAAHYRRSPDELGEEEVRAYLLSLRERGVALGTFKTNHGGIQFLYRWTLDRDWPLFGKKRIRPPRQRRLPSALPDPEIRALLGCVTSVFHCPTHQVLSEKSIGLSAAIIPATFSPTEFSPRLRDTKTLNSFADVARSLAGDNRARRIQQRGRGLHSEFGLFWPNFFVIRSCHKLGLCRQRGDLALRPWG